MKAHPNRDTPDLRGTDTDTRALHGDHVQLLRFTLAANDRAQIERTYRQRN